MNGPLPPDLHQLRQVLRRPLLDGALDPLKAVHRRALGNRFSSGSYTTVEPPAGWNTNTGVLFESLPAPAAPAPARRAHRLRGARARRSPVPRWWWGLDVLDGDLPSARSDRRGAIFSAVASFSAGNALKMPPGDLPVTIAHVANVTRSAASRGGTSAPSASVTASCVST